MGDEPSVEVPEGDLKKGAKLFKGKCAQCHTIEKGGNAKQGPPLWGVFGRQSGTLEGFAYSEANKNSGIVWSDKHMYEYLVNPKKVHCWHQDGLRRLEEGEGACGPDLVHQNLRVSRGLDRADLALCALLASEE